MRHKEKKLFAVALFLLIVAFAIPLHAYRLSDTGQTKCYDNSQEIPCPAPGQPFYGQDAQYRGVQPAFRDNGNGTVTDLNTGLMWQQGDAQNDRYYTWQEAVDYCGALTLAGRSDWRLPKRRELMSIVDYGVYDPAIDPVYFPECRSYYYWSGSTDADDPNGAWVVGFFNGYVYWGYKDNTFYVRCVREGS